MAVRHLPRVKIERSAVAAHGTGSRKTFPPPVRSAFVACRRRSSAARSSGERLATASSIPASLLMPRKVARLPGKAHAAGRCDTLARPPPSPRPISPSFSVHLTISPSRNHHLSVPGGDRNPSWNGTPPIIKTTRAFCGISLPLFRALIVFKGTTLPRPTG